jgi:hypothetical protein
MMFIIRTTGEAPQQAGIAVKLARCTPAIVPGGAGCTDFFCVGPPETLGSLREAGCTVVSLRDGYYEDDTGGGVAIWGQGKYWEIRDTPFTVKEAVGPSENAAAKPAGDTGTVNIRGAVFGERL